MDIENNWRLSLARRVSEAYVENGSVLATLVGGSLALGVDDEYSDIDLFIFWDEPPTEAQRQMAVHRSGGEVNIFWSDPPTPVQWQGTLADKTGNTAKSIRLARKLGAANNGRLAFTQIKLNFTHTRTTRFQIVALDLWAMQIEDYEEVLSLWQLLEGVGLSSADTQEAIGSYLRRNPGLSFTAHDGTSIIGAVLCGHDGRRGYIHHLAVHPEYQRKGVGRRLVDACLEQLSQGGMQKCYLLFFSENKSAISFWKEVDWKQRIELTMMSKNI